MPTLTQLATSKLFDLVPEAVVIGNVTSGLVVAWNRAAEQTFGYPSSVAIGMPIESLVPPELREAHLAGLARYRAGRGGALTGSHDLVELPALHADGTQRWVELRLAPVESGEGEPQYVLAVFRDVTARHRAQDDAAAARSELELVNSSLRDFLAMAAHDLRSPVAGVSMTLDLLSRKWDQLTAAQRLDLFAGARRHTAFILRVLEDLADVASIESGSLAPSLETCDASDLLTQAVELAGVPLALDVAPGLQLHADRHHVQRVTVNLISNAAKYGQPPIALTARPGAGGVAVAVQDAGAGVPEEIEARMFDKFVRGRESAATKPGAGLGLAIVAGLVRANGGTVCYERPAGGGSRFTCWWRSGD